MRMMSVHCDMCAAGPPVLHLNCLLIQSAVPLCFHCSLPVTVFGCQEPHGAWQAANTAPLACHASCMLLPLVA
jgi:hypothetical protein